MSRPPRLLLLPVALLLSGCLSGPTSSSGASSPVATHDTPADGGWITLFDGSAVAGLRGYGDDAGPGGLPSGRWEITDGTLRTIPGAGLDLITEAAFEDFELEFRWAVAPGGNSGVIIAVRESSAPAWATGPEYQLLDDAGHPDGADPRTASAALYDLLAPNPERRLAALGEWNDARIVARDGNVEHWLNGRLVVTYAWDDPDLRAAIAASKFAGLQGFMTERRGRIVFQHHGELAWFGQIRVRPLDLDP